jgi:hypothetical protein
MDRFHSQVTHRSAVQSPQLAAHTRCRPYKRSDVSSVLNLLQASCTFKILCTHQILPDSTYSSETQQQPYYPEDDHSV